jgi:hypothetical protein
MSQDTTETKPVDPLLKTLLDLIQLHRSAFQQTRPFHRAAWLLLSELFTFARHTVTQGLVALGETEWDWSAWYRLFSHKRFDYEELTGITLGETLKEVPATEPYVVAADAFLVPRHSQKMPGTSWAKALGTAAFRAGLARAQRFINLSWLIPRQGGYSRAVPLQVIPAFPEKAVKAEVSTCKDWQAVLQGITWLRTKLDKLGREAQLLLVLVDGGLERTAALWRELPGRVILLGRTARSRVLLELPGKYEGKGRPPSYGERVRTPAEWLRQKSGWKTFCPEVRGRKREMRYRVEGPFLRQGVPGKPMFLIVVHGMDRVVNGRRVKRDPAFYLVSAIQVNGQWVLPLPEEELLAWAWQRWEVEVAHREMKSGFGLGEKQCWNTRSAVTSVQWTAWVYALLLLAGYRTWGLQHGPKVQTRWWKGAGRWSFNTLWRAYRAALWGTRDFQAVCSLTQDNWQKKEAWLAGMTNAVAAAARS